MNKAFYISAIALSFIFLCICGYYIEETSSARALESFSYYSSSYTDSYSYSSYNIYEGLAENYTSEVALISLFFFLFFITTDVLGLLKVKTKTVKVLGIIGISLTGIMLIWDLLILSSPSSLSFDEVGGAFSLYSLTVLAFSIVGLVQSVRFSKNEKVKTDRHDILDI